MAWERGIRDGVRQGLFGLGHVEHEQPVCCFFKNEPMALEFSGSECIIRDNRCVLPDEDEAEPAYSPGSIEDTTSSGNVGEAGADDNLSPTSPGSQDSSSPADIREQVGLRFTIPRGKVSALLHMLNFLQRKFETLTIEIQARDGAITDHEYELSIEETLQQLGIELDEE